MPDEFEVPGDATDELPQEVTENVDMSTSVEIDTDDGTVGVSRTAAFAEVADRPKKQAITDEKIKNDVKFFDDLITFDAELSGTLHAQSNAAASGPSVTHPAQDPYEDQRTSLEEEITKDCQQLIRDLNLNRDGATFFLSLIAHGNDVNHYEYEEGEGILGMESLPLRALTILDNDTFRAETQRTRTLTDPYDTGSARNFDETITDADWYVINEGEDHQQEFPAHDVLHFSINQRSNWHKDHKGRNTYGVWGNRRLEAVRYSLQAKQNTLANKVAMDDKLLAREFYYINVEELFGHIVDPDRRLEKAREYAEELRQRIEQLDADQKPILPEEVKVEIEGPDGDTARNMSDFIQTMNDSIQHALNYHVGAFGRDAGGTDRANKPAKDMSDNSVRHLRKAVKEGFHRLFEIHAILRHEEAREVVNPEVDDIRRYELSDDVRLPELTFDPVDPTEQVEKVRNAISLYEKGVADLNEARVACGLEPVTDDEVGEMYWFKNPTTRSEDEENDSLYGGPEEEPSDESPGDDEGDGGGGGGNGGNGSGDSTGNRRSYPTDSSESGSETIDSYELVTEDDETPGEDSDG